VNPLGIEAYARIPHDDVLQTEHVRPLCPQPAARPPPSARRASSRCELSKVAAAGRERAGGTAGGGAWTTGSTQQAVEKAV
jgi:hypothetical protein